MQAYQVSIRPQSERGARGDKSAYYHWRDLAVGRTIQVFGRELLLTGADEATQRFYQERAGAKAGDFVPLDVRRSPLHTCHKSWATAPSQPVRARSKHHVPALAQQMQGSSCPRPGRPRAGGVRAADGSARAACAARPDGHRARRGHHRQRSRARAQAAAARSGEARAVRPSQLLHCCVRTQQTLLCTTLHVSSSKSSGRGGSWCSSASCSNIARVTSANLRWPPPRISTRAPQPTRLRLAGTATRRCGSWRALHTRAASSPWHPPTSSARSSSPSFSPRTSSSCTSRPWPTPASWAASSSSARALSSPAPAPTTAHQTFTSARVCRSCRGALPLCSDAGGLCSFTSPAVVGITLTLKLQLRCKCEAGSAARRLWDLVDADTWTFAFMEKHPSMFPWAHFPAALARFQTEMRAALSPEATRQLLMAADLHGSGHVPYRRFYVRHASRWPLQRVRNRCPFDKTAPAKVSTALHVCRQSCSEQAWTFRCTRSSPSRAPGAPRAPRSRATRCSRACCRAAPRPADMGRSRRLCASRIRLVCDHSPCYECAKQSSSS